MRSRRPPAWAPRAGTPHPHEHATPAGTPAARSPIIVCSSSPSRPRPRVPQSSSNFCSSSTTRQSRSSRTKFCRLIQISFLPLLQRHRSAVVRQQRSRAARSTPGPGAQSAHHPRPTPSGRSPSAHASTRSAHGIDLGVAEHVTDVERTTHRRRRRARSRTPRRASWCSRHISDETVHDRPLVFKPVHAFLRTLIQGVYGATTSRSVSTRIVERSPGPGSGSTRRTHPAELLIHRLDAWVTKISPSMPTLGPYDRPRGGGGAAARRRPRSAHPTRRWR